MAIETVLRTTRELYEQKYFQGTKQLFQTLFSKEDIDESAAFLLDEFIDVPYAIAYRDKNNQAHVRNYIPGSGTLLEPPIASEKTPIDESLRDQAVEGVEATSGFTTAQMRKADKITSIHNSAHAMTKNKQAIDMLRTGVFYAKGIDAADIGKNEDFARDAGNDLTANFSSVTIDEALTAINAKLDDQHCPATGRYAIMGQSWQTKLESDSTVLSKMQANTANVLIRQNLNPPEYEGTEGLEWLGEYRPSGSSKALQLFSYNPGTLYKASSGASGTPWIPDDEIVASSFNTPTFRVYRGIDVVENGSIKRIAGEVVFDSFVSSDPVAENIRSATRHMFVYGNINHTVRSTGSNF